MNYTYDGSRPREADMNFQEGISGKVRSPGTFELDSKFDYTFERRASGCGA